MQVMGKSVLLINSNFLMVILKFLINKSCFSTSYSYSQQLNDNENMFLFNSNSENPSINFLSVFTLKQSSTLDVKLIILFCISDDQKPVLTIIINNNRPMVSPGLILFIL